MRWVRTAVGAGAVLAAGAVVLSGGTRAGSVRQEYVAGENVLRVVERVGERHIVWVRSLGDAGVVRGDPRWLSTARPLGSAAPRWAERLYRRSLLVLRALTDERTGAAIAGARDGWRYVWARDAGAVAIAFAAAGYRDEARRIARFLLGLDLEAAARFHPDGTPVEGRAAQGDAAGWVAAATVASGAWPLMRLYGAKGTKPGISRAGDPAWEGRADYQEGDAGDYLGNALAASWADLALAPRSSRWRGHGTRPHPYVRAAPTQPERAWLGEFATPAGTLARRAGESRSGIDSAAAWAVRPFSHPALHPPARRSLRRLAAASGRYGIVPSQDWDGGVDPWTAPTAWTAWSLAALGERRPALRLMAALRRAATPAGLLPERVDARTGVPTSTTPLAWSHAFATLALRELWP